jgi:hypothetical protein
LKVRISHSPLDLSLFLPCEPDHRGAGRNLMKKDQLYPPDLVGAQALERVEDALSARSRLAAERDRLQGTAGALQAETSLWAAHDELTARRRWLRWVEERDVSLGV